MTEIKIHNKIPVQTEFLGNGAVYHGFAGLSDDANREYNDELCKIEAKRVADMKLKIARTRYQWWAWDSQKGEWNWETERMQNFYVWLKRMKEAGVLVSLNTGWCSPGDVDSSSWGGISPFTVEGDWEKSVQNYADWVSETLHQLVEVRGFTNVAFLNLFTEPQRGRSAWTDSLGLSPYEVWLCEAKAVHNTLVRDGRRNLVKLIGPNEGSTVTAPMLKWVAEQSDFLDLYSCHTYECSKTFDMFVKETEKLTLTAAKTGASMYKTVDLKPNMDYEFSVVLRAENSLENYKGNIFFGIFDFGNEKSIVKNTPIVPCVENSISEIKPYELGTEQKKFSFKFHNEKPCRGKFGIQFNVKNIDETNLNIPEIYLEDIHLIELDRGIDAGWTLLTSSGSEDSALDWQRWAKTGMQYVPGEDNSKNFCFDEYNTNFDHDHTRDEQGAEIVNAAVALMNAGVKCSFLWTLFDQIWIDCHSTNNDCFVDGDHRWGVMPCLNSSLVPYKSFYAFELLSRYVDGNGSKIYCGQSNNSVHATMSVSKEGFTTVVVVNNSSENKEFNITFETPVKLSLNRHCFDPAKVIPNEKAEIIGIDKTVDTNGEIIDTIAPFGVIVYTTHND